MIITEFPNSRASNVSFQDFSQLLGKENMLVLASHDCLHTKFCNAPLSVKTTLRGQETYFLEREESPVDSDTYLITNRGRDYESIIESDYPIESFSLFFKDGMVEKVISALAASHERNLEIVDHEQCSLLFLEHLMHKRGEINNIIQTLRTQILYSNIDQLLLDEFAYDLLGLILRECETLKDQMDNIPSIKKSTRTEILKRISRVQKYIHANFSQDLCLQDLAEVAHMSEYHFLRMFKAFYSSTPYQYLAIRRMFKAKELLKETHYSIKDICSKVGYTDESSFSRMFKRNCGISPSEYRFNQS